MPQPTAKKAEHGRRAASEAHGLSKRAARQAAAEAGKLPRPPSFRAKTHARWRPMLAEVVALAKAGGIDALRSYKIPDYSTSPRAIRRYRDLALVALSARASAK